MQLPHAVKTDTWNRRVRNDLDKSQISLPLKPAKLRVFAMVCDYLQ